VKSASHHDKITLAIWGGVFVRFLQVSRSWYSPDGPGGLLFSPVTKAPDWILCLEFYESQECSSSDLSGECSPAEDLSSPETPEEWSSVSEELEDEEFVAAALTAHNELIKVTLGPSWVESSSVSTSSEDPAE
jgi:hypothetical protein